MLRTSLIANASFSTTSGTLLITLHESISNLFGVQVTTSFWIIGIGLLLFAMTVFLEARKQRPKQVLFIIIQDLIWVLGSAVLIVFNPFEITSTGNLLVASVALIVLFFAVAQSIALSRVDSISENGMKRLTFQRMIKAPKDEVWRVVSDVANYHEAAPNIDDATILSGKGEGMIRKCRHGSDSWNETCIAWFEGEQYSFEVNTTAPDYPYPLDYLKGTWQVEETGMHSSKVTMHFNFVYKRRLHNLVLHPFIRSKFSKICEELLHNWQKQLERQIN